MAIGPWGKPGQRGIVPAIVNDMHSLCAAKWKLAVHHRINCTTQKACTCAHTINDDLHVKLQMVCFTQYLLVLEGICMYVGKLLIMLCVPRPHLNSVSVFY